ncbi:MAG: leucyl aminopeptidase [Chloroflexi bacterium RBG_16_50_11]|nr:MAG: leucyl aminopeptidase [Chloroflexi bacterium RBG_16_50_11]
MEIKAATGEITGIKTGAIIISHYEGEKRPEGDTAATNKKLNGAISELIKQSDIKGKLNEITMLHSLGKLPAGKVVVLGLGKKKELNVNKVRGAMAEVCRYLRGKSVTAISSIIIGEGINGIKTDAAVQAMTEGALLGLYTFRKYLTKKENNFGEIKEFTIAGKEKRRMEKAIAKGKIIAEAANYARDMVNEPSNFMTPTNMADAARQLAKKYGLKVEVLDRDKMKELGMGGLLGVSQGSQQPPKFIILSYKGRESSEIDLALVGKGITFDSGGISIKPSENMADMKGDMAGGASVLAALTAIAQLKPKINVTALVPATENLPSGTAMKPGDIITAMNGKSIEVLNTDAEGRLILADALSYATKIKTKAIIDVATLTGACQIALGNITTGAFTNNQPLLDKVIAAGNEVGEPAWQMPMFEEYKELIKSDFADIKNTGNRYGGAITAAKFLEEFVDKITWVHLDIAGTSSTDKEKGYLVKGATGVPVRTLVNFALSQAKK